MNGALTISAGATVSLTNETKSSNVFFIVDGAISVAAGAEVKGTLFSKSGAVGLGANVNLEGRMLSLAGAITMGVGSSATQPPLPSTIPIFCESDCSPAPTVNVLGVLSSFALFASNGSVGNTGISGINGIIGTNAGTITGYTGGIHIGNQEVANDVTEQAVADLDIAYIALMALTPSVAHAATFLNETLAPGVYHIPSAGALGGVIILDAANDSDAIFVFRFAGAFNIAAASKIILANGARRCNVFWMGGAGVATGALNIGAASELQGTFISHGGACNSGGSVFMAGRQLSTLGAVNTNTGVIYNNPECVTSRNVNATVAGTITADQNICKDSTPNDLTLTGNTGSVIKWQKSSDLEFSSPIDISVTSTTLSSAAIGSLSATTYFRALVQNGSSPSEYSNVVTITVPSTTWNGTSWSNGVPTITTTTFITGNYSEITNLSACTLTVSNGAVVVIPSGFNVTLNSKLTVSTGCNFTLNNNSNLIQQTDAINSGVITIKRMSTPVYRFDYTLWSSPVSGSQTLINFSPLTSNIAPSNIRFYSYNTLSNQYNSVNPVTTVFEGAKGYLIRSPNNWISFNAGLSPAPQRWTGTFTGMPRNGTIPFTMVNTGSTTAINATGNPYPSAISLDSFINENSNAIEGTLWFWRKFNDDNNLVSYSTCTIIGCTANNNATYSDTDFISVGQGFMVKAKEGQTILNFTNSMRSNGNVDQFFKSSAAPMDRYWLKMTNSGNNSTGQNLIAYTPTATNDYDSGLDGLYSNDSQVAFYSKAATQEVVINARTSFDVTDVIPLLFKSNVADTYTFSLNQKEGIFNETQAVLLRDNYNNSVQNLTLGNYSFSTAAGTFTNRFDIIYQNMLSNNNPRLDAKQVIIYNKNQTTFINSGTITMDSIKIFDIQGRLLFSKSGINDTKTSLNLNFNNQVVLFQITSQNGDTIIKKVIN